MTLPESGTIEDLFAEETNTLHIADTGQVAVAQAAIDVVKQGPGRIVGQIDRPGFGVRQPDQYLELTDHSL